MIETIGSTTDYILGTCYIIIDPIYMNRLDLPRIPNWDLGSYLSTWRFAGLRGKIGGEMTPRCSIIFRRAVIHE